MTQDWQRLGRRLAREHDKNRRAVGTRIGSATVMLWEQWTEQGRARVLVDIERAIFSLVPVEAQLVAAETATVRTLAQFIRNGLKSGAPGTAISVFCGRLG